MATKDFRASQIETSKIIGTGSISGTTVGIAIYSGSVASNRQGGTTDSAMFNNVGSDVFLFVSGAINKDNTGTEGTKENVVLFGGDVVVSGTLYAERQVIEVDSTVPGNFYVTGNMYVEPDSDSTSAVTFSNAAGTAIFNVDSTNKRIGIGDTGPDALLDIQGEAASGVPSLKIDHDDADVVAIDIDSANTTQAVIDVFSSTLTVGELLTLNDNSSDTSTRSVLEVKQNHASATGATAVKIQADSNGPVAALHIDRNAAGTAAADGIKGIYIDLDQIGEITSATANVIGVDVEIETNSAADGTVNAFGQKITMTGDTDGTHSHTGLSINLGDADNNTHIELLSSADTDDKLTIAVGAAGESTITTIDDAGANAHLNFTVDGNIDIQSNGGRAVILNEGATNADFRVESVSKTGAILVDGATDQVALLSKGTAAADAYADSISATGRALPGDVALFVSGAIGGIGTLAGDGAKGSSVFGGDLVVSGASSFAGDVTLEEGATLVIPTGIVHKSDINTSITFNNDRIRLFTNGASKSDFTSTQVLFMSGGAATSTDEAAGADVSFYASGSVGSKGTTERGTSVFGGDLVVSGNVTALGTTTGFTSPLTVRESDGSPNVSNVTTINVTNGTLTDNGGGTVTLSNINNTLDQAYDQGGSGLGAVITVSGQPVQLVRGSPGDIAFAVTGSALFGETSAEFANHLPPLPGDDTTFFVSGAIGSLGSSTGGVATFGGDVVASGSISVIDSLGTAGVSLDGGSIKLIPFTKIEFGDPDDTIFGNGTDLHISGERLLILSGGAPVSPIPHGTDVNFFVSGSTDGRGKINRSTAAFGGDVYISGSLYAGQRQVYSTGDNITGTSEFFLDPVTVGNGSTSFSFRLHQFLAPFAGTVKKVMVRSDTGNSNALNIKVYSSAGSDAVTGGTSTTKAIVVNSANTTVQDDIGHGFTEGQAIAVSVQRNPAPGNINITLVVEYFMHS